MIIEIFNSSRRNYGTRKIKSALYRKGKQVSRRRISRIMRKYDLVSNYTKKKYRKTKSDVNNDQIENIVNRKFDRKTELEVVVSDLTYVRVGNSWNYICTILDLFNREIIGYSCGKNKDANLVLNALSKIDYPMERISIFHTDRGSEFKNILIDDFLEEYKIERSLSRKGSPYDNAVAEATYKVIKTEFVYQNSFENLLDLELYFMDYVNWYNNKRIHGSLGYRTPKEFRSLVTEKKLS